MQLIQTYDEILDFSVHYMCSLQHSLQTNPFTSRCMNIRFQSPLKKKNTIWDSLRPNPVTSAKSCSSWCQRRHTMSLCMQNYFLKNAQTIMWTCSINLQISLSPLNQFRFCFAHRSTPKAQIIGQTFLEPC